MKRYSWFTLIFVFFIFNCLNCNVFAAKELYDDFSQTYIDSQRWKYREFVREIDPVAEKLVSKIGNDMFNLNARNNTSFQNPSSIDVIKFDIIVVATNLDVGTNSKSFARVDGRFYNALNSGTEKGDIWAALFIGDRGSGLEAWWEVWESLDDEGNSWEEKGSGTLIVPGLTHGNSYTVKLEYNGAKQFTFDVGGVKNDPPFTGPARQGTEFHAYKGLETGVNSDGGSGIGYASALFDNVYINNMSTTYDTFDSAPLDNDNWKTLETVREISSGKLRLNVQADGAIKFKNEELTNYDTPYLEAKVAVKSESWLSSGALAFTRIDGYFYNDSHGPGSGQDYNKYEGNIHVQVRIMLHDDDSMVATAVVFRIDDPGNSLWTNLFSQDFTTPISFDRPYTLSIDFTVSTFTFKCNDETLSYSVATPIYMPYNEARYLTSMVYAGGAEESGYMKVDFDDVYVTAPKLIRVPQDQSTIQQGINAASCGDTVLVDPGTYCEDIEFHGKAITVRSVSGPDATIIESTGFLDFDSGETRTTVLEGFTVIGVDMWDSSPTIKNCKLVGQGTHGGGGHGSIWAGSSPELINCEISGGDAGVGGGYDVCDSSATFINCIFFENSATSCGGGLYIDNASVSLINCTFWGNSAAESGGAIYLTEASSLNIVNSIFWNDTALSGPEIYNDGSSVTVSYCDISGGYQGEGNKNDPPLFVDAENGDFHLQPDSPCIDAGKNDAPNIPQEDKDGKPRIIDGNDDTVAIVDMGAYEFGDICKGDFDTDGDVDGSDLAVFAADFGRTDCNSGQDCEGDFDEDNDVDGSDLAVFAADFGRTDCPVFPRIYEYSNSGCLPGSEFHLQNDQYPWCGDDKVEVIIESQRIHVLHRNATYNCCPDDIKVFLSVEGNLLRVMEKELLTHPCYCLCCYNVKSTIVNIPPGIYILEYCWDDYETGPECYTVEIVVP